MGKLQLAPLSDRCRKVGDVCTAKFGGFLWSQAGVIEDAEERLQSRTPFAVRFDSG
jgi:hypothetical protein